MRNTFRSEILGPQTRLGNDAERLTADADFRIEHAAPDVHTLYMHGRHLSSRQNGSLNWSVQRPAGRALERDEAGIQRWKSERWPETKKKPKRKLLVMKINVRENRLILSTLSGTINER